MKQFDNISAYIADFPETTQKFLQQMRQTISNAAPEAEEAISYGIPTFKLKGNLVHFGGYKNHIGFYPGAGPIKDFSEELTAYKLSKGTIRFPLDKPLPLELIIKIVRFRAKQNLEKAKKNKLS